MSTKPKRPPSKKAEPVAPPAVLPVFAPRPSARPAVRELPWKVAGSESGGTATADEFYQRLTPEQRKDPAMLEEVHAVAVGRVKSLGLRWQTDGRPLAADTRYLGMANTESGQRRATLLLRMLLDIGPVALADAVREVAELGEAVDDSPNYATALGNILGRAARREVIRRALVACEWNLSRAAEQLGIRDSANLVRIIKDVGLAQHLADAKQRGDVLRGRPSAK